MYFSGHFMTIFRSNYFHLKLSFFKTFLNIRYIYPNVFKIFKCELNPLDNKKDIGLYVLFRTFSGHFRTIFRSNYFHLKLSFFNFCKNNCYIYANVFKIFKFELNPLDNKKDISLYVLFRTFSGHFRSIFRTLV
jgi:hypothetical protein